MVAINFYNLITSEGDFTRTSTICNGGDICQVTLYIYFVRSSCCTITCYSSIFTSFNFRRICVTSSTSGAYCVNIMTICCILSLSNSYAITSFNFCLSGFQLFYVNCISIVCTRSYISDFATTHVKWAASDVDGVATNCHFRTIVSIRNRCNTFQVAFYINFVWIVLSTFTSNFSVFTIYKFSFSVF